MPGKYPWYDIIGGDEDILQGDFIKECPVVIPTSEISTDVGIHIISYNVIIMSQS